MRNGIFRRVNRTVVVGILIGLVLSVAVFAQPSDTKPASARLNQRITLDADDAYLPTVLAILAEKSGYNIVTGPGVSKTEKLTIKLKDAPIEEAMNLVVRAVGLSYELVGSSFLVAKPEFIKSDAGLTSYVLALKYADPQRTSEMLKQMKATVTVDSSSGKLLIIASPKVIAEIRQLVDSIDEPAQQIMLSARVIEVGVDDEEKVGVDWGRLTPVKFQIAEGTGTSMKMDRLDNFGVFYRQQPIFDFAVDWLLSNNKADILSNTQVATMNGRPATIQSVDVFPYLYSTTQQQFNPQQANAVTTVPTVTLEREKIGVILSITPKINSDGYVTTSISAEVSSIFSFIGRNQDIPWTVQRKAETTIRAKDGETIVIGGLLGIKRNKTKNKVPLLGDLPYFGGLFSHNYETMKKTDMIIEVTPTILKEGQVKFKESDRIIKSGKDLDDPTESRIVKTVAEENR